MPMSAVAAVCAVRGWSQLDGVRESAVSKRIGKIRDFWRMSRRKIDQLGGDYVDESVVQPARAVALAVLVKLVKARPRAS